LRADCSVSRRLTEVVAGMAGLNHSRTAPQLPAT
jgi:hypothetical protein